MLRMLTQKLKQSNIARLLVKYRQEPTLDNLKALRQAGYRGPL